jgi:hypothetical protein
MSKKKNETKLPKYRGKRWIRDGLPTTTQRWRPGKHPSANKDRALGLALNHAVSHKPWKWPKRRIFFVADPHADAEAFNASLVASGGVRKTGPGYFDIKLTKQGRKGLFIIGGDCMDKGPSSLEVLRSVRNLMRTGARVKLLAGNHDVRLMMGLRAMSQKHDTLTEHLFIRMGPKVVPLLKEIHTEYLGGKKALRGIPNRQKCRQILYPSANWFDEFPKKAARLMSKPGIERETTRMQKKIRIFEDACRDAGLSLRDVYAAARKCHDLFLKPGGEFAWFFRDMQLAYREGSLIFIHAGFDDQLARVIAKKGVDHLNRLYRKQIRKDLFDFYYGALANGMRTKYRDVDKPLTRQGVIKAHHQGIHTVVHGHRNITNGQRIMLRKGMIHIESDITMDRNSRKKEGLEGYGIGVTVVDPKGKIIGISTDYPYAKVFEPGYYFQ